MVIDRMRSEEGLNGWKVIRPAAPLTNVQSLKPTVPPAILEGKYAKPVYSTARATRSPSARSPDRLGDQLLQLAVEHGCNFRDAGISERAEERGRPVVLDAGLPSVVRVDEHP